MTSLAADEHVHASQGQPFLRNHFNNSKCPLSAATEHVSSVHGHPFSRSHFSISKLLPSAAA